MSASLIAGCQMAINWNQYSVIAFLDSNIALEGLALEQLPWKEIDPSGPILVLVVPTVLREVDSKKLNSRLADHARRFNKTLRPLISGRDVVEVRQSPAPRVELALADCPPVNWDTYPELDRSEPDARIVGEALATRGPELARRLVISHDIRPLQLARQHGVRVHHVGDNWLRPKELSEAEKKAANFQRELAAMRDREPKLRLGFTTRPESSQQYRVLELTTEERASVQESILALNPMPSQQTRTDPLIRSMLGTGYDHTLERRYELYERTVLPNFMSEYERKLEMNFGQVELILRVENVGKVPAHSLLITLSVAGGWLNDRWVVVGAAGPSAPRARQRDFISPFRPDFNFHRSPQVTPRHEVVVKEDPKRSNSVELACTDFRHGYSYEYRTFAWRDPRAEEFRIEAIATASNLTGEEQSTLIIPSQVREVHFTELVDLNTMRLKVANNVLSLLQEAKEAADYDQFDFDGIGWDKE
jgi:hypothetical protein